MQLNARQRLENIWDEEHDMCSDCGRVLWERVARTTVFHANTPNIHFCYPCFVLSMPTLLKNYFTDDGGELQAKRLTENLLNIIIERSENEHVPVEEIAKEYHVGSSPRFDFRTHVRENFCINV